MKIPNFILEERWVKRIPPPKRAIPNMWSNDPDRSQQ